MGQKKVLEIQVLWKGKRLGVDVSWVPNALPDFFKLSHQCGEHLFLASFYRWLTGLYGGQVICLRSSKWNNSKAWADWRSEAKMELGWARSPHLLGLQEQMVSTFSYTCEQVHGPCSSLVFCFYSQEAFWAHFWLFAACTQHSEKRQSGRQTNTALSRDGKIILENGSVLTWGSAKWSIMAFPSTNSVKLNELKEKSVFRKKLPIFVCLRESCLPSVHTISLHVYSWKRVP